MVVVTCEVSPEHTSHFATDWSALGSLARTSKGMAAIMKPILAEKKRLWLLWLEKLLQLQRRQDAMAALHSESVLGLSPHGNFLSLNKRLAQER